MNNIARLLAVFVFVFCIAGCSGKLTEETAKDVLEKEWLAKQPRLFTSISFEKGSAGFDYFEQLISDGSFELQKKEEVWNILSREPMYESFYVPRGDIAGTYDSLTLTDELKITGTTSKFLSGKSVARKTVVCTVRCFIKERRIQAIESILNNEKKGIARVKFNVVEIPISPQYEELSRLADSDPKELSKGFQLKKTYKAEAQLKRYDEGWKIN